MTDMPVRIGIVGARHVGATTAYALLLKGVAAEIRLPLADNEVAQLWQSASVLRASLQQLPLNARRQGGGRCAHLTSTEFANQDPGHVDQRPPQRRRCPVAAA